MRTAFMFAHFNFLSVIAASGPGAERARTQGRTAS